MIAWYMHLVRLLLDPLLYAEEKGNRLQDRFSHPADYFIHLGPDFSSSKRIVRTVSGPELSG